MAKTSRRAGSYRSLGTMPDGVVILTPKLPPTHFEPGEIREILASLKDVKTPLDGDRDGRTVQQSARGD